MKENARTMKKGFLNNTPAYIPITDEMNGRKNVYFSMNEDIYF